MKKRRRIIKAQSTLEYLVALTAIVAAVLVAMSNFAAQDTEKGIGKLLNSAGEMITNATGRLPSP